MGLGQSCLFTTGELIKVKKKGAITTQRGKGQVVREFRGVPKEAKAKAAEKKTPWSAGSHIPIPTSRRTCRRGALIALLWRFRMPLEAECLCISSFSAASAVAFVWPLLRSIHLSIENHPKNEILIISKTSLWRLSHKPS